MLIHSNDLDNISELEIYSPYNMQIVLFLDLDLMCSPNFNKEELGKLRPVLIWAQKALHMAHVINTFPREIEELDFSSPIISMGLKEGVIDKEMVIKNPKKVRKNLEYIIPYLKNRAEEHFQQIENQASQIESIDILKFNKKLREIYSRFLQRPPYWDDIESSKKITKSIVPVIPNDSTKWIRM
jgi:hypothetical protein